MDWYNKLANYFPEEEMKHPGQLEELLEADHIPYHKLETENYVVMYAEFSSFLFIDYLLVTSNLRGQGFGTKLLDRFKRRGKNIILEVEPADEDEESTIKRIRFYEHNGFQKAEHILYTRTDQDGEELSMDVWYWSPNPVSEREIMRQMAVICREIHSFKSHKYYGRVLADPDDVLEWES